MSGRSTSPERRREILEEIYQDGSLKLWLASFGEMFFVPEVSEAISEFVREKMRERLKDPRLCDILIPKDYGFGTHRVPLEVGFLEAFHRPNVEVVSVKDNPIERVTPNGLKLKDGTEYAFDVLIFATGFDAGTGALTRIDIRGRDGRSLKEDWSRDIRTTMGLQVHGYPNLFTTATPLAPSAALCNMTTCLQQQVEWISDCIRHMRETGIQGLRADPQKARRRGSRTTRRSPRRRSWSRPTPGTWVRTSRANPGVCSPTSAASAPIGRNATRRRRPATKVSRCAEAPAREAPKRRLCRRRSGRQADVQGSEAEEETSMEDFRSAADAVLNGVVTSSPRVPGVVAMATDRQRNIYEGAAGKRRLDRDADMTTDTVFAIFSTTKAITGTAALQLVEDGKLDLDAPAKNYAPDIGKLQVIEGFDARAANRACARPSATSPRGCC